MQQWQKVILLSLKSFAVMVIVAIFLLSDRYHISDTLKE